MSQRILPLFPKSAVSGVVDRSTIVYTWALPWDLVGQLSAYDDCGSFGFRGCLDRENHHEKIVKIDDKLVLLPEGGVHIQKYKRSCGRAGCPICYEKWAGKEAHSITHRLETWEKQWFEEKKYHLKAKHIIISPSERYLSDLSDCDEAYPIFRDQTIDYLKRSGAVGGCLIYHQFRRRCRFCGFHPIPNSEDSCPECNLEAFIWYFSPHFHSISYAWIDGEKVKQIYEDSGWIIRNLGVRKTVSGTASYQLSHASVNSESKYHTVVWFGALSYSRFYCPRPPRVSEKCLYCEGSLGLVKPSSGGDLLPNEVGDYFLVSDLWVYAYELVFVGFLPRVFVDNPRLDDGSPNLSAFLLTESSRGVHPLLVGSTREEIMGECGVLKLIIEVIS